MIFRNNLANQSKTTQSFYLSVPPLLVRTAHWGPKVDIYKIKHNYIYKLILSIHFNIIVMEKKVTLLQTK